MASGSSKDEQGGSSKSLEVFTGENTAEYRRWRRKAELYLMGLPTTVPSSKWGPRLLEHLSGEAEELMEHLEINVITEEKGYQEVFKVLDERYKELDKDELQRCLKDYFYATPIKQNETYRNFIIRLDTAYRGLTRHKVELPEPVRGWILMRKLSLDATSEALIMTSTKGSLKYPEIVEALKALFPNGRGSGSSNSSKSRDKEVFIAGEAEPEGHRTEPTDETEDPLEVMEAIAFQAQEHSDYDSEDVLDVYENYASIRKKMQEKRMGRGYRAPQVDQQWKLEGNVQGRLSLLKAKTKCHICRRTGHWKRECPLRRTSDKDKDKKESRASGTKEVNIIEELDDGDRIFESYIMDDAEGSIPEIKSEEKAITAVSRSKKDEWKFESGELVRIHNKVRKGLFTPHGVKDLPVAQEKLTGERTTVMKNVETSEESYYHDNFHTAKTPHRKMECSWTGSTRFELKTTTKVEKQSVSVEEVVDPDEKLLKYEQEVLSAIHEGAQPVFSSSDAQVAGLDAHAVPDTACRRTLIGEYVLSAMESRLNQLGLRVTRHEEENDFRFGNSGVLKSRQVARIPVTIGSKRLIIHAAVLPESGSRTPFLLSKELLKGLECVLDTCRDEMWLKRIDQRVKMGKTDKGHYAIPILPGKRVTKKPSEVQAEGDILDLQECLRLDNQDMMPPEEMDRWSDHSEDEPGVPINGQEMMKAGKFKDRATMEHAYITDKKHLKWVRSNVQPQGSSAEMRRYRLYVELRDQIKMQRVTECLTMSKSTKQMPKLPVSSKSKACPMTPPAAGYVNQAPPCTPWSQTSRRRPREGQGWTHEHMRSEMEMEMRPGWNIPSAMTLEDMDESEVANLWEEMVHAMSQENHDQAMKMTQVAEIMGIKRAIAMFQCLDQKTEK
eukprot:s737_g23.t1